MREGNMFCAPVNVCVLVNVWKTLEAQARLGLGLSPGCPERTQGQLLFFLSYGHQPKKSSLLYCPGIPQWKGKGKPGDGY